MAHQTWEADWLVAALQCQAVRLPLRPADLTPLPSLRLWQGVNFQPLVCVPLSVQQPSVARCLPGGAVGEALLMTLYCQVLRLQCVSLQEVLLCCPAVWVESLPAAAAAAAAAVVADGHQKDHEVVTQDA